MYGLRRPVRDHLPSKTIPPQPFPVQFCLKDYWIIKLLQWEVNINFVNVSIVADCL